MRKNTLLFVAVFAALAIAVGGYFAYSAWNKEHANAADVEALKVDAGKLLKAFQTNEIDANKSFLSNVLAL